MAFVSKSKTLRALPGFLIPFVLVVNAALFIALNASFGSLSLDGFSVWSQIVGPGVRGSLYVMSVAFALTAAVLVFARAKTREHNRKAANRQPVAFDTNTGQPIYGYDTQTGAPIY